jgi:hypothetical protein
LPCFLTATLGARASAPGLVEGLADGLGGGALADLVPASAYGCLRVRACPDNLGAIGGPVLALVLVSAVGIRTAIALSAIPGILRRGSDRLCDPPLPERQDAAASADPLRVRPDLTGQLVGMACSSSETSPRPWVILRASELRTPQQAPTAPRS